MAIPFTNGASLAEVYRRMRAEGVAGVARRLAYELYHRLDAQRLELSIAEQDLCDPSDVEAPRLAGNIREGAPRVGWICTAPGPGSGGHTTLFRMADGLADFGMRSVIYLYDPRGGDLARHERVIRENWPWLRADVRTVESGFDAMDAVVASSWETAHVLARRSAEARRRLYFVQDYEPYFYPRGSLSALADMSYRFGFRTLALGAMVHDQLRVLGIPSDEVPWGRDAGVYSLRSEGARSGVVFYAKPGNDRRGYLLGKLALQEFHRMRPDQPIHVFGGNIVDWSIPVVNHGRLPPSQLNRLYNEVVGGLALSFTNVSLVADEMLAAGAIPVINDNPLARADLDHPDAKWAYPSPSSLAEALCAVVDDPNVDARAARAAAFIRPGWDTAQKRVASIILDELDELAPKSSSRPAGVSS
ncbi:glycosyltransferase family 1 protein [Rathayibacter sp. YIM 133350]|uniref:rhamnosyltransferase WsaF family glycosyltransferase n=1 Tax=Rathayibacter sp. YIM 133350 TaxID=3131992 RepID=UPI00307DEB9F